MNDWKKHDGFTIIEVMIAMGIFAIGILAVASMQVDANMRTTAARNTTEAIELATLQVEFLQGLPLYDDTLDLDNNGTVDQFDSPPELAAGDHPPRTMGRYTIQWTVTDNVPIAGLTPNPYTSSGLPDPLTISKTIEVRVFETRNPARILARHEMVKIWEKDG